jgi:hypothetical protein
MATVTGMTAAAINALVAGLVKDAEFDVSGHLILTLHDDSTIDAGAPTLSTPDASTTVKGIVELATSAETSALTDAVRAITPAGLATLIGTLATASHTHAFSVITGDAANNQIAQMAAHTIKGNNTASTADQADLTIAQVWAELNGGWQTWSGISLLGDTSNPTIGGGSSFTGQYRIYDNTLDADAQLTIGSGWSAGSGHYYLTIPSSRSASNYKLGVGQGMIFDANDTTTAALGMVVMKTGGTKLYLAMDTTSANGWLGSGWALSSGDQVRWSIRGLRLT